MANPKVSARIKELKTATAANVVKVEIRKRSARVQVGQNLVDRMCRLRETRAAEYADHPGGATGMLVKEYRGKNGQQEVWKFDESLVAQTHATLKQVAIEEGQWSEKRELSDSRASSDWRARIAAGRQRAADWKRQTARAWYFQAPFRLPLSVPSVSGSPLHADAPRLSALYSR